MLTITRADYMASLGVTEPTTTTRLRGLPCTGSGTGSTPRRYPLAWVLPTLKTKHRADALVLLDRARMDDSGLYIGGDAELPHAQALCAWIEADEAMAERLKWVRGQFFNGLAATARGQAVFYHDTERLRLLIAGADAVLPFILTGERSGLPAFAGGYSRAIAVLHHAAVEAEVAA